jgi:hypothetical protein
MRLGSKPKSAWTAKMKGIPAGEKVQTQDGRMLIL